MTSRALFFLLFVFSIQDSVSGLDGTRLSLAWGIPFLGILLSLSLLPAFAPSFWHRHYGKIISGWTFSFMIPSFSYHFLATLESTAHILLMEYIPFVALIGALFVVTGGIRLKSSWVGSPASNMGILFLGTFLSSWIGTTGASMLLIRPLIQANAWRRHQSHIFIFFIFLVANIGGALTPLGDPPLFIGFLEGVPFFWPLKNLMGPTFFLVSCLLTLFFIIDTWFFRKEDLPPPALDVKGSVKLNGKINILFLALILVLVLGSGYINTGIYFNVFGNHVYLENIMRDGFMIIISFLSLKLTRKRVREDNHFSWDPLIEVAKVFFGIFLTVMPILAILKAGEHGVLKNLISQVNNNGAPDNTMYFWITGFFSSFLDNAPSYLVFFFMAGGDATVLTTTLNKTLMAISMGAVYLGAMTYIGNAPNFMIRSIANRQGIKMPTFFMFIVWAFFVLVPFFFLMSYLYL